MTEFGNIYEGIRTLTVMCKPIETLGGKAFECEIRPIKSHDITKYIKMPSVKSIEIKIPIMYYVSDINHSYFALNQDYEPICKIRETLEVNNLICEAS